MVFIGYGFGGVKFFQKKENAENYIKENYMGVIGYVTLRINLVEA